MAKSTSTPTQGLAERIFGGTPTLEDWLQSGRWEMALMFMRENADEQATFYKERLKVLALAAEIALAHQSSSMPTAEFGAWERAVTACANLDREPRPPSALREGVWDDIDGRIAVLHQERRAFLAQMATATGPDEAAGSIFKSAVRLIDDAYTLFGSERTLLMRDARERLREGISLTGKDVPDVILCTYGWLGQLLQVGEIEAANDLERAATGTGIASYRALRTLASGYAAAEEKVKALGAASRALTLVRSPESEFTVAAFGTMNGQIDRVRKPFENAIVASPSYAIEALADARLAAAHPLIGEIVAGRQTDLRNEGKHFIAIWASNVSKVAATESVCEMHFSLAGPTDEGPDQVLAMLGDADMLTASHLCRYARTTSEALLNGLNHAIEREVQIRATRVAAAKMNIEAAADLRNAQIEEARNSRDSFEAEIRDTVGISVNETDRAQKGCMVGLGSGCGIFALYVTASFILGAKGVEMGFDSPIGIASLVVAIVPIVAAMIVQVTVGLKKMAADARMQEAITKVTVGFDKVVKEAEAMYKTNLAAAQAELDAAVANLDKIEQAVRFLNAR